MQVHQGQVLGTGPQNLKKKGRKKTCTYGQNPSQMSFIRSKSP